MKIDKTIFKQYDIRGIYPKELNLKAARLIGAACAGRFPSGIFVVGYDARFSSGKLLAAFLRGFRSAGRKSAKQFSVKNIGLATTPMFYFSVNRLKAVGGAMATASHNPPAYGGFKVVGRRAEMISGKEIEKKVLETK